MSGGFGQTAGGVACSVNQLRVAGPGGFLWVMRIERFDPLADDERLRACFELFDAGRPTDDPAGPPMSPGAFRGWWAHGFTGDPRQVWLATDASGPVGCYLLELPERENAELAVGLPIVAPARRQRGIGTALLAHCGDQARRAGRTLLTSETREGSPGEAFARAAGAQGGLREIRRALMVNDELFAVLASLRAMAEPAAAGYHLLSWTGATPAEHLDQVVQVNMAVADAPRDAGTEALLWDAARVRETETRSAGQGLRLYSVAAQETSTGEFAALTQMVSDPAAPGWAFQQLTAVIRQHRGRRLGLLTKVAMLQWLAGLEPGIRKVLTINAETNDHMVAINEQLGFRISDTFRSWELSVADVLTRAQASEPALTAPDTGQS
jgi:GNAT superfamily N-acetyltransferase/RimJ/RimL family protein N-acetyltransferase